MEIKNMFKRIVLRYKIFKVDTKLEGLTIDLDLEELSLEEYNKASKTISTHRDNLVEELNKLKTI